MSTPSVDWKDLEVRGYVVVRSFVSAEEVQALQEVYERAERNETLYVSMVATPQDVAPVAARLATLLPSIRAATDIKTDVIYGEGFFFPTEYTNLGWHTDHKSYYAIQDHYHYLNFWIPVIKPRRDKSGLGLVPMDRLQQAAPEVYRAVVRRGGAGAMDGLLHYEGDGKMESVPLRPGLLDEIGVAPEVMPGDLIVARTDLLHRTQDADTVRVALAMRGYWGGQVLRRQSLLRGSPIKHQRMLAEPTGFRSLLAAFWSKGKDAITMAESQAFADRLGRREIRATLYAAAARCLFPLVLLPHRLRSVKTALGGSTSWRQALVRLFQLDLASRRAVRAMRQKNG